MVRALITAQTPHMLWWPRGRSCPNTTPGPRVSNPSARMHAHTRHSVDVAVRARAQSACQPCARHQRCASASQPCARVQITVSQSAVRTSTDNEIKINASSVTRSAVLLLRVFFALCLFMIRGTNSNDTGNMRSPATVRTFQIPQRRDQRHKRHVHGSSSVRHRQALPDVPDADAFRHLRRCPGMCSRCILPCTRWYVVPWGSACDWCVRTCYYACPHKVTNRLP